MYEAHFGFQRRPFASVPRADQYFPAAAIELARQTLSRCIERSEGAGMVVGPSGTGKTLLCQVLADHFRERFSIVLLKGRLSTRRCLLQTILYQLDRPYRDMDEGELRLALFDHLSSAECCPGGMLLLVDEAHTLPLRLIEEIRMIGNLVREGKPRTTTILAGAPILEERFAGPKLESFSQRLIARCYLESFNRTDTEQYIQAQVSGAGGSADEVFPLDACQAVYQATDGVPRLINQVCDHVLLMAYAAGVGQVNAANVEEAWADLQQLPTPWNADSPEESENTVIEFGGLDDDLTAEEPSSTDLSVSNSVDDDSLQSDSLDDEPAAVLPPLRVRPTDEEALVDPSVQLDRIGETLDEIDEEFEPAGSIGPQTVVDFDEQQPAAELAVNPFDEPFEEEEAITVSSRVSMQTSVPDQSPVDENPVDKSLDDESSIGERAIEESSLDEHSVDENPIDEPATEELLAKEPGRAEPTEAIPETSSAVSFDPFETAADTPCPPVDMSDCRPRPSMAAEVAQSEPETLPIQTPSSSYEEPDDSDLIVVEDACHHDVLRPVVAVKRQEYRQLFSKLRGG